MGDNGMPQEQNYYEQARGWLKFIKGWVGMSPPEVADYTWIPSSDGANLSQESSEYERGAFTEDGMATPGLWGYGNDPTPTLRVADYFWIPSGEGANTSQESPEYRGVFTEGAMATPGLWGYGGNQSPGIFDYGLHAIKEGGKDISKNGLGLVEGTTLVLSNGSGYQQGRELGGRETLRDISRGVRSLKGADWLEQDTGSEGASNAEDGTLVPNNGIMYKNTDLLLRANGFLPGQAEVVNLASDASGAKNIEQIPGFKQVVREAIASGILPNPATMQSDYKFIEGGFSTPILKLASVTGGIMMDKKGNVYLIADGSVGYGLGLPIPVTGSVGQGYFGNAEKSDEADYREALAGGAFGTTTGAGVQGNVSIGTSGVISGELSLNPSIAKTFGGRYAWYLFNIYD